MSAVSLNNVSSGQSIAQEILLVTPVRPDGSSAQDGYAAAQARLAAIVADFRKPAPPLAGDAAPQPDAFTTPVDRETYRGIVEKDQINMSLSFGDEPTEFVVKRVS